MREKNDIALNISLIGYSIYLVMFLDSLMREPKIGIYSLYSYLFIGLLMACIVLNSLASRKRIIIYRSSGESIIIKLLLFYSFFTILTLFSPMKEYTVDEYLGFLKFFVIIFFMVYVQGNYGGVRRFLKVSYYTISLFIIYLYATNDVSLNIANSISTAFFGGNRIRAAYGFYNVNGMGNLVAMTLIIGILLLDNMKEEEARFKGIRKAIISALEIFEFAILMSTGSRNAIVTIMAFLLSFIFMHITDIKNMARTSKRVLQILILIIGATIVIWGYMDSIYSLLEASYRLNGFTINLPLLTENNRVLFGLGVFSPGLFGLHQVSYGMSFTLDNYYLYILLETGVIGLLFISYLLLSIWKGISQFDKKNKWMLSAFIAWLVSGLAETSVIYPKFPSSMVFLILFLVYIKEEKAKISQLKSDED